MSKILLAAGLCRDFAFFSESDYHAYLEQLEERYVDYEVLEEYQKDDGFFYVRIVTQYNNSDLIQIYDKLRNSPERSVCSGFY